MGNLDQVAAAAADARALLFRHMTTSAAFAPVVRVVPRPKTISAADSTAITEHIAVLRDEIPVISAALTSQTPNPGRAAAFF
jgi:hypothetical protein